MIFFGVIDFLMVTYGARGNYSVWFPIMKIILYRLSRIGLGIFHSYVWFQYSHRVTPHTFYTPVSPITPSQLPYLLLLGSILLFPLRWFRRFPPLSGFHILDPCPTIRATTKHFVGVLSTASVIALLDPAYRQRGCCRSLHARHLPGWVDFANPSTKIRHARQPQTPARISLGKDDQSGAIQKRGLEGSLTTPPKYSTSGGSFRGAANKLARWPP
jgi:hypothetical protein